MQDACERELGRDAMHRHMHPQPFYTDAHLESLQGTFFLIDHGLVVNVPLEEGAAPCLGHSHFSGMVQPHENPATGRVRHADN